MITNSDSLVGNFERNMFAFFMVLFMFLGNNLNAQLETLNRDSIGEPFPSVVFKLVEQMPCWRSCKSFDSEEERQECSKKEFIGYISENLIYPEEARENGAEGKVGAEFVIKKDGSVGYIRINLDPGYGMGDEVKRILKQMPQWNPGKQRGRTVSVLWTIPVMFRLTDEHDDEIERKESDDQTYLIVDDMPRMKGCEKTKPSKVKKCTTDKISQFITERLVLPKRTLKKTKNKLILLSLVVEKDGSITNAKILKDIGYNTAKEVLRVIGLLPEIVPGKQNGENVRVLMNIGLTTN